MFINDYYADNTPFIELALGEVFYSQEDSDYFMVTQEIKDCVAYNAVSLTTGYFTFFKDEAIVKRIRGEFRVK